MTEFVQVVCAWCGVYKWSDGTWRRTPDLPGIDLPISHGICPDCTESMIGELRAISRIRKRPDESRGGDETPA